ncbi:SDR family oxidoreductase [Streptomyces sp. NPDC049040]|uniref:SDR family oxidoreductase n=1 Tax=Streptomyces sp. NPDC049040 TaxID=3365593 RepID=UPI00372343DB
MRVAVAGGTGLTGRHVVDELVAAGHEPVVLARSRGVDLATATDLDGALVSVDALIDVTNVQTARRKASFRFFDAVGRHLLAAEERAGVRHHVALSIVGVDRVDLGYYEGKRRQEELLATSRVPWTVLRCTQFHEFAGQVLALAPGPVAVVPRMLTRPVAVAEVAAELVRLAVAPPQGMAPELAGPREEQMADMARQLLKARGSRRLVLPLRMPGATGRAMAGGGLLPTADGPRGTTTFEGWLAAGR